MVPGLLHARRLSVYESAGRLSPWSLGECRGLPAGPIHAAMDAAWRFRGRNGTWERKRQGRFRRQLWRRFSDAGTANSASPTTGRRPRIEPTAKRRKHAPTARGDPGGARAGSGRPFWRHPPQRTLCVTHVADYCTEVGTNARCPSRAGGGCVPGTYLCENLLGPARCAMGAYRAACSTSALKANRVMQTF